MRTHKIGSITIEYPDEIAFCFNPMIVNIYGDDIKNREITEVLLDMTDGKQPYTEKRAPFQNNVFFDISSYTQASFDYVNEYKVDYKQEGAIDSKLGLSFSFILRFNKKDSVLEEAFTFETFVLWGAMRVGERYNGDRVLTWFKNYPFSVGLYSANAGTVQVKTDGEPVSDIELTKQAVWNLMLKGIKADDTVEFFLPGSSSGASVFDNTFDFTFQGLLNTATRIKCVVNDCDHGVYVRWINRHGMYCYWLFQAGDESRQVENDGEFIRNNMQDYNYTNGYHGGTGRKQRKTENDMLPICAPLVDSETYDFLFELATSPVVDLYAGMDDEGVARWKAVNVSVERYVKTRAVLQDFVCTLILPELNLQSL